VTFMSVIPVGLTSAHRERLSLRKLSKESQVQESTQEQALTIQPSEEL